MCRYLQAKNTKPSVFLVYVRNTVDFLWCAVIYRYSCYLARVRKAKAPLWGLFERSEKNNKLSTAAASDVHRQISSVGQ